MDFGINSTDREGLSGMNNFLYNIAEDAYHRIDAVGSTVLGQLDKGGDYLADYLATPPSGSYLTLGSAIHLALLQPEEFGERVKMGPVNDRRLKDWKEFVAQSGSDFYLITPDEHETIIDICNECLSNRIICNILQSSNLREVTSIWLEHDVRCKGRFDILDLSRKCIFDIKTTSKGVTSDKIRWAVRDYRYNIQGAHYISGAKHAGVEIENYGLIFVCKSTKKVRVYELSQATLERAEERRQKLLTWYADYQRGDRFAQYEIEEIDI